MLTIRCCSSGEDPATKLQPNVHSLEASQGRSLLWVVEDSLELEAGYFKRSAGFSSSSQYGSQNFKQTETTRLEGDLRGWFNVEPPAKRRPDMTR